VRRLLHILLNAATVLSLMLCVVAVVLWVRSYRSIDLVTRASARLHRAVSGGGLFLESLTLNRERGSWRDRSTKATRTTEDYAKWPGASSTGATRPWLWMVKPYDRATLLADAWGPDLHRALPEMTVIDLARQRTFDNADGSLLTYRLIGRRVWVPYWLVVAITGLLPAWRTFARHRRSRRSRLNLCASCGYDLRATPDRCPECGAVPTAQAARLPPPLGPGG
jgi:hypothetical protein